MHKSAASSILLRRVAYGDYDLIVTLLTDRFGKLSLIAKYAKKSTKRFAGILEPFAALNISFSRGRRGGLAVLQEASLASPFPRIRTDILATAYASYWVELVDTWLEEGHPQEQLYRLLDFTLKKLDQGQTEHSLLSILFQIRFLRLAGMSPELGRCSSCHCSLEDKRQERLMADHASGGIVCSGCSHEGGLHLSLGTVKQLQWLGRGDLDQALRIRFSQPSLDEATSFLENFVPYHLGRSPKSLKVLHQLRGGTVT